MFLRMEKDPAERMTTTLIRGHPEKLCILFNIYLHSFSFKNRL